jgi:hypothetical protein
MQQFIGTAWNNGKYHPTGAGYGIKISAKDRDRYFRRNWQTVDLYLPGSNQALSANVDKPSFWSDCRELISKEIGSWLIREGKGKWSRGNPPTIELISLGERSFRVTPAWNSTGNYSLKEEAHALES